jgi:hypothetical protein
MFVEKPGDLVEIGLDDALVNVADESGPGVAGESPDGPGSSGSELLAGTAQAGCLMLKTDSGVTWEIIRRMVFKNPMDGRVGKWPAGEDGVVKSDLGIECSGEGEDGPPSMTA